MEETDHPHPVPLPTEVADELSFDRAAPRAVRQRRMPPEVRVAFEQVWDGVIGDIHDELSRSGRAGHLDPRVVRRILERIGGRIERAQILFVVAGVYHPFPGRRAGVAAAGVSSGGLAGTQELVAFTSMGAAATGALAAAVMAELAEVYFASSARTRQYRRAGRAPSPERIATDVAGIYGAATRAQRAGAVRTVRWALLSLTSSLVPRTSRRFFKGLAPGVGMVVNAGFSVRDVRRVLRQPLAPVDAEEAERLREQAAGGVPAYDDSVARLTGIFGDQGIPEDEGE